MLAFSIPLWFLMLALCVPMVVPAGAWCACQLYDYYHRSQRSQRTGGLKCPECDYNLAGLPENRCPECGLEFDPALVCANGHIRILYSSIMRLSLFLALVWYAGAGIVMIAQDYFIQRESLPEPWKMYSNRYTIIVAVLPTFGFLIAGILGVRVLFASWGKDARLSNRSQRMASWFVLMLLTIAGVGFHACARWFAFFPQSLWFWGYSPF